MTFLRRKRLKWRQVFPVHGPPEGKAELYFSPEDEWENFYGNQLLAQILFRVAVEDDDYFREFNLLRKKFRDHSTLDRDKMPTKTALYLCACDLREELGRDPSRDEVLDRLYAVTTSEKHLPPTPDKKYSRGDIFDLARLSFLRDSRGKRRK